jgi:hypothetical protein
VHPEASVLMTARKYYQGATIRRHIEQAMERARLQRPVPARKVPRGEVKQYDLERMLGIRYRNGGFV